MLWHPETFAALHGLSHNDIFTLGTAANWAVDAESLQTPAVLDQFVHSGGVFQYKSTDLTNPPIGMRGYFLQTGSSNPGEYFFPAAQADRDKIAFDTDFTLFIAIARTAVNTATRGVLGTRHSTRQEGFTILSRESGGARNWQLSVFDQGGTAQSLLSGVWVLDEWAILGLHLPQSGLKRFAVSQAFADAAIEPAFDYQPRTDTTTTTVFQLGQDGNNVVRGSHRFTDFRYYKRALTEAEFNLVMADMLLEYGIALET